MASLYPSPNFNFPGYPAVRPGNLTPSIPSIAGSHHVSSTWPPGMFTLGALTPHLTIDQANSIFDLATRVSSIWHQAGQGVSGAVRTGGHAPQLNPGDDTWDTDIGAFSPGSCILSHSMRWNLQCRM